MYKFTGPADIDTDSYLGITDIFFNINNFFKV